MKTEKEPQKKGDTGRTKPDIKTDPPVSEKDEMKNAEEAVRKAQQKAKKVKF